MITCRVCGTENDDLAIVCRSCKSFVQSKVDTLNLFETMWGLMEAPAKTFKRIALARAKNYVLALASLCGIAAAYGAFWVAEIGKSIDGLPTILGIGVAVGIPAGILGLLVVSAVLLIGGRLVGGSGTLKNVFAVTAYSSTPVIFSLIVVFPVEIALFGIYLFDRNPSPMVLKPVPYVVLMVIDAIAVLWSLLLLVQGLKVAQGIGTAKAATLVIVVTVAAGVLAALR